MANSRVEPTSVVPDTSAGSFRTVLKNRPFLLLWMAQLLSQTGFNAANYGIIVIVTAVTGSTVMVGFAIVSFTLPAVPFSLLAGVYVDYLNKRLILWVSNALRALVTGLIVVALIWQPQDVIPLYVLTFLISLITQFFTPAETATIPLLVGKKDLVPALSLFSITLTLAQAIGFLVLGRLITLIFPPFRLALGFATVSVQSVDMLFVVVAVTYAICSLLILAIPVRSLQQHQGQHTERELAPLGKQMAKKVRYDLKESWELIRNDHILFLALLRVSFVSILLLVIGELAGPFVKNVLHLPADDISIIFAPAGFGLVLGGALMPYLTGWLGKRRVIAVGSICTAAGLAVLPLGRFISSEVGALGPWAHFFVGAMAFIIGIALDMINIPAQTVMQEHAPEDVRGRVFSFQAAFYNGGSIPVILFAGVLADRLGIETVLYLLAASLLGFQLWASRFSRGSLVH